MSILLLPNQLFDIDFKDYNKIYLYEHPTFFTKYEYHKMKLAYHRATMKYYFKNEINKSSKYYIEYDTDFDDVLKKFKNSKLTVFDPTDIDILKDIVKYSKKYKIDLEILNSKLFILTKEELDEYQKDNKLINSIFYKWVREKKNILMNNKKPLKGKWSFDTENRKPFPKDFDKDIKFKSKIDKIKKEAYDYVNKHFPDNIGKIDIYLPINRKESNSHFKKFLKERLPNFGIYQDASSDKIHFGYHAVISPMLNIGLLDPLYVVQKTEQYYKEHNINYGSVEGFIRQIISWREYVRMVYLYHHTELIKNNFFNHTRKIPKSWYNGTTDMPPIDSLINKALDTCYLHHIERLMHVGNFMLLNMFNPKDVLKWYISVVSIDAYDWVMETNVYGMSQFSVGNLMMTRPYFSSSNYIDKMSSFKKKKDVYNKIKLDNDEYEWYEIWDVLYYYFIYKNKTYLAKNYATANAVKNWNNKSESDKKKIIKIAKLYFDKY